jgi:RNA recognition motif-containing protein
MNIFVARLNYDTQASDLRYAFEEFGAVDSAKVITDHYTGNSKGFGFVEMPNDDEAREAIAELNDESLDGRTIVVKKAKPRGSSRNSSSSGYYNTYSGSSY